MPMFQQTNQNDPNAFDYQSSAARIALEQQLAAENMKEQMPGTTTVPGQTSKGSGGGWVVPNRYGALSALSDKLLGTYMANKSINDQSDLNKNSNAAIAALLQGGQGQPQDNTPVPQGQSPAPNILPGQVPQSGPPAVPPGQPNSPQGMPVMPPANVNPNAPPAGTPQGASSGTMPLSSILKLAQMGPMGAAMANMQIQRMSPNWDIQKTDDSRIFAIDKNNPQHSLDVTPGTGQGGSINTKMIENSRPTLEAMRYLNQDGTPNQANVEQANLLRARAGAPALSAQDLHGMYGAAWAQKDEDLVGKQDADKLTRLNIQNDPQKMIDAHTAAVAAQDTAAAQKIEAEQKIAATSAAVQSRIDQVQMNISNITHMKALTKSGSLRTGPTFEQGVSGYIPTPNEQEYDHLAATLRGGIAPSLFPDMTRMTPATIQQAGASIPGRRLDPSAINSSLDGELIRQQNILKQLQSRQGGAPNVSQPSIQTPGPQTKVVDGVTYINNNGKWYQQ